MYKPIRDGIEKNTKSVIYTEESPPPHLSNRSCKIFYVNLLFLIDVIVFVTPVDPCLS